MFKSILESILVYQLSLPHIPKNVLENIRKKCFCFLWIGKGENECIHLVKLEKVAKYKEGRWGLKKIHWFV